MKITDAFLGSLERGIRSVVESSTSPTLIVAEGAVAHMNAAAATFFRVPASTLVGRRYAALFAADGHDAETQSLALAIAEGTSIPRITSVLRNDGTRQRVETVAAASLWNGGPAALVRLTEHTELGALDKASETDARRRVLVVDDEVVIGNVVRRILRDHDVVHVTDAEQAMSLLLRETFDVILCDVMMPGMSGVDLFEMVCRDHPLLQKRFVFVTGGAFTKRARDFLANVPNPRIDKPFEASAIRDAVTSLSGLPH
jgi:CheY-like chemotaxis protein